MELLHTVEINDDFPNRGPLMKLRSSRQQTAEQGKQSEEVSLI